MNDLPLSWCHVPLWELVENGAPIIYGILQPGPEVAGGVPYVRPTEIVDDQIDLDQIRHTSRAIADRYRRSTLNSGDLLLSIVGTIGKVAVVPEHLSGGNITQSSCRIRPALQFDRRYVKYFLKAPVATAQYAEMRLGTAVPRLNLADVRELAVPVAPADEQRRIVAKLDALSSRSKRARAELVRSANLWPRAKQAMLRAGSAGSLTADWRATRQPQPANDLVSRTPAPEQSRGGRDATEDVKPGVAALSVNNPGTDLPDGWTWVSLRRIARQETGHTPSRSHPEYWGGGVPWIGIRDANAHHGQVIYDTFQKISEAGLANSSARILPAGTVCLSRTASVGYVTIMGVPMATSQDFATWTCTAALHPKYLMYALMAEGDDIRNFGEGSTHTTIYFPEIRAFNIALAPLEEQQEIVRRLDAALAKLDRLAAEAQSAAALLDRLDQAILAKAFRGELVPQDPSDKPASVLLERIRASRAAEPKPAIRRRRCARASAAAAE